MTSRTKNRYMFWIFTLPILLWAGMVFAYDQAVYWVWIVLIAQMGYFLVNPSVERAVWVMISYLFTLGGGTEWGLAGPRWTTWLSYVIIPIAFLHTLIRRHQKFEARALAPLCTLSLISFLSAWIHHVTFVDLLAWHLHFFRYPILFLALVSASIPLSTYQVWIKTYLGLVLLQIPATMGQFLWWAQSGTSVIGAEDGMLGTIYGGLTGMMGLTVLVGFCSALGGALAYRKPVPGIAVLFLLFTPLILGGSSFPLAAGVMLAFYIIFRWCARYTIESIRVKVRSIGILLGGIAVAVFIGLIVVRAQSRLAELSGMVRGQILDTRTYKAFVTPDPEFVPYSSRQMFIGTTVQWFRQNPEDLLLGSLGPRPEICRE
jgi:hypothetical protein